MLNYKLPCSRSWNVSSFWWVIKQKLITKEISIFSNSSHFEWRTGLSDTILKGDHPRTIPAKFVLIWFSGFREDLNGIFNQNMSNLYNQYKSVERNISQKNPEYMLIYLLSGRCSLQFELILIYNKAAMDNWRNFLFLVTATILNGGWSCRTQFWNGITQGLSLLVVV